MNVENIKATIERIESIDPNAFEMASYMREESETKCGAAACIAGWAVTTMLGKENNRRLGPLDIISGRIMGAPVADVEMFDKARKFLGLNYTQAIKLFTMQEASTESISKFLGFGVGRHPMDWFDYVLTGPERHQSALNVLSILMETGGVEWGEAIAKTLAETRGYVPEPRVDQTDD